MAPGELPRSVITLTFSDVLAIPSHGHRALADAQAGTAVDLTS